MQCTVQAGSITGMDIQELTVREAEARLSAWGEVASKEARDRLVLTALASRVPKNRIMRLTGIARSTIDRIIEEHQDEELL